MSNAVDINDAAFEAEVLNSETPVVVDFNTSASNAASLISTAFDIYISFIF